MVQSNAKHTTKNVEKHQKISYIQTETKFSSKVRCMVDNMYKMAAQSKLPSEYFMGP